MRYIGSKAYTLDRLHDLISRRIPKGVLCDPFGGIGTVGSYFKRKGYTVWCGDLLTFAHCFQVARVENNRNPVFRRLRKELNLGSRSQIIELLNRVRSNDGWFVTQYAKRRRFFTRGNAARIEACRNCIRQWSRKGWVTRSEEAVLLASLINSMDKVANTAGTYYAYLKGFYRKAKKPFRFELMPHTPSKTACRSFLCEASDLVAARAFDILYLDPPYNERNYSNYYHLPETIARAEAPTTRGKAGIPVVHRPTSAFNSPTRAHQALLELLSNARFRLLAFHYSDDGLISPAQVRSILSQFGKVEHFALKTKGYTTHSASRTVKHRLYLVSHD